MCGGLTTNTSKMKTKEEILDSKFKIESVEHDTKVFMYDALDAMEEYAKPLKNRIIELEEKNAELMQTIIAKTQREIMLENRLTDGNK